MTDTKHTAAQPLDLDRLEVIADLLYKRDWCAISAELKEMIAQARAAQPVQTGAAVDERAQFEAEFDNAKGAMGTQHDVIGWYYFDDEVEAMWKAWQARATLAPVATQPELTVWYGPMPESNGKSNFTAVLMRKDSMWDGPHVTIERGEYPDRIRYEADRVRHLIGEIAEEPFILDYDADKHSGYVAPVAAQQAAARQDAVECDSALRAEPASRVLSAVADLADEEIAEICVHVRPTHFAGNNGDVDYLRYDAAVVRTVCTELASRCRAEGGMTNDKDISAGAATTSEDARAIRPIGISKI